MSTTVAGTALVSVASGIRGDEGMKELKCNTSPLLPERSEGKEGWMRSRRGGLFQHHRAALSVKGGLVAEKNIPNQSTPHSKRIRRITSSILFFTSSLLNRMTLIPFESKYSSRI